jgi:hypothetical protein
VAERGIRGSTLALLLALATPGCSRQIEEDPPIPEHRIEPCETWCAMIFDPECPLEVEVNTEQECFDYCSTADHVWAPVGDNVDACAATYVPYVDCMALLSCDERHQHYDLLNVVPVEELPCGPLLQPQLECQTEHY